ncbi:MAG: CDP-diacylglycerol--glycerol-3-phosphate 3-phosphatidyltransferase [Eubacteriales bacterium]|nr:CDP-diacylglycerol--glycerol-3-phosphate 3-phosphatidyltransferase [Eubacteriales bacterium]
MNLPNKLTMLRIILVIPLMLLLLPLGGGVWAEFVVSDTGRVLATIIFIVAALTDFIDGRIARARGLITNFGKLMDSLADKLLVLSTFIALTQLGRVHGLIVVIILARELLVTGIRQVAAAQGTVIAAGKFGKWKAACQMFTLVYLLLEPLFFMPAPGKTVATSLFGDILLALTIVLTVLSGLDYVLKHRDLFSDK